ncbi:hypothetical protein D6779_00450, partial [Candidatus Parcubacteria bacterium]
EPRTLSFPHVFSGNLRIYGSGFPIKTLGNDNLQQPANRELRSDSVSIIPQPIRDKAISRF